MGKSKVVRVLQTNNASNTTVLPQSTSNQAFPFCNRLNSVLTNVVDQPARTATAHKIISHCSAYNQNANSRRISTKISSCYQYQPQTTSKNERDKSKPQALAKYISKEAIVPSILTLSYFRTIAQSSNASTSALMKRDTAAGVSTVMLLTSHQHLSPLLCSSTAVANFLLPPPAQSPGADTILPYKVLSNDSANDRTPKYYMLAATEQSPLLHMQSMESMNPPSSNDLRQQGYQRRASVLL